MTKEQFISLLRSPSTINLNMVKGLEEITERFPYFQNAHLLLAKQYQGHQNIRYESYLRKAAAYAPDRRVLYELIKLEPEQVIHMHIETEQEKAASTAREDQKPGEPVQDKAVEVIETIESNENAIEDIKTDLIAAESKEERILDIIESLEEEEIILDDIGEDASEEFQWMKDAEAESHDATARPPEAIIPPSIANARVEPEPAKTADPKEIIANRLRELSQTKETNETINTEAASIPVINEESTPGLKVAEEPSVNAEAAMPEATSSLPEEPSARAVTETSEHATAVEEKTAAPPTPETPEPVMRQETDVPTEATPVAEETDTPEFVRVRRETREPREPRDPSLRVEEQHTFLDWLKLKDIPVIPTEQVSEYFNKEKISDGDLKPGDQLIDQFIKTEPRIVPARSEFYSPGNMARQSAVDHEDLISETLARIYAQQGNIPKAIDAYKRLSLKSPEKSSYFAALIKELEEKEQS